MLVGSDQGDEEMEQRLRRAGAQERGGSVEGEGLELVDQTGACLWLRDDPPLASCFVFGQGVTSNVR